MPEPIVPVCVWLKRDLRATDHPALATAVARARGGAVFAVFLHEPEVLAQRERDPSHAAAVLDDFLTRRGRHYAGGISSPLSAPTSCSRLSPYLAFGAISMRMVWQESEARRQEVKARLLEATHPRDRAERRAWQRSLRAMQARLHWHCHFMQKLEDEPATKKPTAIAIAWRITRIVTEIIVNRRVIRFGVSMDSPGEAVSRDVRNGSMRVRDARQSLQKAQGPFRRAEAKAKAALVGGSRGLLAARSRVLRAEQALQAKPLAERRDTNKPPRKKPR